jgi:hypothetical protein
MRSHLCPTLTNFQGHVEEMTGINTTFFFTIHDALLTKGHLQDTEALTSNLQLLLILNWLHEMPKLSTLGQKFNIAKSLTSTTIHALIYNLHEVLQELIPIILPAEWSKHKFEGVVGAIDCTLHYCCCIHPGQANFYCSDKCGHFLTAQVCALLFLLICGVRTGFDVRSVPPPHHTQVLCSMDGSQIYEVTLGHGHNNDSGMAILTGLKEGLLQQQVKVLGDGGYGAMYTVTPTDKDDAHWQAEHAA